MGSDTRASTQRAATGRFEIDDLLTVRYAYHYGGITPFFEGIAAGSTPLRVTRCVACGVSYCPARYQCSSCWERTTWRDHDGRGTVESLVWAYWIPYDSPAREWVDLPYAYGAVRLDGCVNLLRTRVTGVEQTVDLGEVTGRRGEVRLSPRPTGRVGDLFFELDATQ